MPDESRVTLMPRQQDLVDELVASGRYDDASDVVQAALRLLEEREAERKAVIARIEEAIAEGLESGPATELDDIETIIARAEAERQRGSR